MSKGEREGPRGWVLLLGLGVLAYAIVVVAVNSDRVSVDFVFFEAQTSLLFLFLLGVAVGIAGTLAFPRLYSRRRRKQSRKARDPGVDVGRRDEAERKSS